MTADTVAGDTAVIKGRTAKRVGVVTVVTGIRRLGMISRFTRCCRAVVAADTGAPNFIMVNPGDSSPAG